MYQYVSMPYDPSRTIRLEAERSTSLANSKQEWVTSFTCPCQAFNESICGVLKQTLVSLVSRLWYFELSQQQPRNYGLEISHYY